MGGGHNWHSAIGYAVSENGESFKRFSRPILDRNPSNPLEIRGLEDPRITKINNTFYMAYAAYNGKTPRLCVATSSDLQHWTKHQPAFKKFNFNEMGGVAVGWKKGKPAERRLPKACNERTKAGGIFPKKIKDKYWMLFNEYRIWLAYSDDGISWKSLPEPFLSPRKNTELFDNVFVEMGPPPIKTEKGWLVFYHGVNDAAQYHLGFLLLDLNNPKKILFRSEEPIFGPQEPYELSGIVDIIPDAVKLIKQNKKQKLKKLLNGAEKKDFMPQVTFVSSAVIAGNKVRLFYGAGDSFICTATAPLKDILALS